MLRVLALIAARSGSRGLAHKNIQKVGGRPLLEHAIRLAKASQRRGEHWHIVVSTDSRHYASLAARAGADVPFVRPASLATNATRLVRVIQHAVTTLNALGHSYDVVLLLSVTTPFTRPQDIRRALLLHRRHGKAVVSVVQEPLPDSWRFALAAGRLVSLAGDPRVRRRQEGPRRYRLNGALYVASPSWLKTHGQFVKSGQTYPVVMPKSRSLDIEDAFDLRLANLLWPG